METLNTYLLSGAAVSCLLLAGCNSDSLDSLSSTDSNSTTSSYRLLDSGQTDCYDNDGATITCPAEGELFYGQDAQYEGNQFSLFDNGDGTVTDNVTGLTWQQMPDNIGLSWQDAVDICANLELGGKTDWRIPTTKELFSISDFSVGWPYLDSNRY